MSGYTTPEGDEVSALDMMHQYAVMLAQAVDKGSDSWTVELDGFRRWKAQYDAETAALRADIAARRRERAGT